MAVTYQASVTPIDCDSGSVQRWAGGRGVRLFEVADSRVLSFGVRRLAVGVFVKWLSRHGELVPSRRFCDRLSAA